MITFYTQAFKKARKNFQEKQNIGNTRFAPLPDTAMSSKKNANFLPTPALPRPPPLVSLTPAHAM